MAVFIRNVLFSQSAKLIARRSLLPATNFSTCGRKFAKNDLDELPDPIDHATGLEKREMLAELAGDPDPFNVKIQQRAAGTKDKPTEIPSAFEARIVGCICEEDSPAINWMWLYEGQPKRCQCGHWYKLVYKAPI